MTTSQPKYNTDGHQVWNPDVGIYATSYWGNRESYGGIIGALQDINAQYGGAIKSYPHNFAGIIAAIQDLTLKSSSPPVLNGPGPGGGTIDPITGDWIEITPPAEGTLWFDTRQGRLFCYINSEWVQTNGADGLAAITNDSTPPLLEDIGSPAPGQFWYDRSTNSLWVHDGVYVDSNGDPVNADEPSATPRWRLVNSESSTQVQTTSTLPLVANGPKSAMSADTIGSILEEPEDLEHFTTQQDYNWWTFESLLLLEEAIINKSEVVIGEFNPVEPQEGLLWYDTQAQDLKIYYVQNGNGQWIPATTPYSYDEELNVIRDNLDQERIARETAIETIHDELNDLDIGSNITIKAIQEQIYITKEQITGLIAANSAINSDVNSNYSNLIRQINSLNIPDEPDLSLYATKETVDALQSQVDTLPTIDALNLVSDSIPDVTSFVEQSDIDEAIDNITVEYLPRTGGELTGSFIFEKVNFEQPALDFSTTSANSRNAFKFQTLAPIPENYTTFGSTDNFWEYAWQFSGDEDFCWIYNDNNEKVFSINREGPACSELYIGDFHTNNSIGRVMTNTIDVRARLTAYQTAFEQARQAISDSTDFSSLKSGLLNALSDV